MTRNHLIQLQKSKLILPINQIIQCDSVRILRFHHIEDLILDVAKWRWLNTLLSHPFLDGTEEIIERPSVQVALAFHVKDAEKIL